MAPRCTNGCRSAMVTTGLSGVAATASTVLAASFQSTSVTGLCGQNLTVPLTD